jgi:hypothetical protein
MDSLVLLLEHGYGTGEDEIDTDHMAKVLAGDWCFWYEAKENIGKLRQSLARYEPITGHDEVTLEAKLAMLEERIDTEPKDRRWRLRSKIGTRKRWYELVGDVAR